MLLLYNVIINVMDSPCSKTMSKMATLVHICGRRQSALKPKASLAGLPQFYSKE